MIIGIDASRANHDQKTGVEWYAWHIIQELKTLVSSTDRVILYSDEPLKGELAKLPANFENHVLRWPPKRFWTQIRLSWEMFRRPPDVLFVPAHVLPLIHPKKSVITIHDVAGAYFPKAYNAFERFYSVFAAKHAMRTNTTLIVPTEHVKADVLRLTGVKDGSSRIEVIPHAVDERFRETVSAEEKKRVKELYHLPESFLLFTGRLEEKKNVVGLVQAYNLFRYRHKERSEGLVLVGKPGFGYEEVRKEIDASPYKKDIVELGWIDGKDMPALFQLAKLFVFLSWYEGFGIPLLEAFASGTPVVSASTSCLPEVGGDACLFVDPHEPDKVEEVIFQLVCTEAVCVEYVQKGKRRAALFSWKKSAERTFEIISKTK